MNGNRFESGGKEGNQKPKVPDNPLASETERVFQKLKGQYGPGAPRDPEPPQLMPDGSLDLNPAPDLGDTVRRYRAEGDEDPALG